MEIIPVMTHESPESMAIKLGSRGMFEFNFHVKFKYIALILTDFLSHLSIPNFYPFVNESSKKRLDPPLM